VGLPRTNLVKKPSEVPTPAASAPAPAPFAVPSPFAADGPFAASNPFAAAIVPVAAPAAEPVADVSRESYRTKADSIEVDVLSDRAPVEAMRGQYASSPSASELLERAAALGPARMTWESIVLPADPILHEKRTPHVTERRARLTRVVKITLAACLGVCVLALGVSALSGDSNDAHGSSASATTTASAALGKTVASKGVVPVEPLDGTKHGKAARRFAPAVTTAAIVRNKRR
jgi:hypothetical protein